MAAGDGQWENMWTGGGGVDFVEAAKIVGGSTLGYLMLMAAILSNVGLYAGYLATGSRPAFQMSRDRLFPKFFGVTHKSWGTPWVAVLVMGLINAVLINFNFDALITIDVFLLMFPYVLIYIAIIVLRVREPEAVRPFRVPMPTWLLGAWVAAPIAIAIIALFVNGVDVRDIRLQALRQSVGIIFQETFLFSATVRENIGYGRPDASFDAVQAAAEAAQAHDFITKLDQGYDTVIGEPVGDVEFLLLLLREVAGSDTLLSRLNHPLQPRLVLLDGLLFKSRQARLRFCCCTDGA
jgi:amino acid transporter